MLVPLPFLDTEGLKGQFGAADGHLSILMLGIMPYVSAYIVVEILSLCIPFLKKLRSGDYKGRLKLKRLALVLALALAIYQAHSLISSLKGWDLPDGNSVITVSNSFEHAFLVSVLVVSFYLLVALCELISRFGIGHGISIILLSGICGDFIGRVPRHFELLRYHDLLSYSAALLAFCGLISLAYILLKTRISVPCYHERNHTTVDYFQLNLSPSSTVALTYAATFIMLPVMLLELPGIGEEFVNTLRPGSLEYNLLSLIFVIMFSFLFGWAFLHPRKRVARMRARGWRFTNMDTAAEKSLFKRQMIYNLPWTLFLYLMVVVPSILISSGNVPFYIGGSSIPVIVAISLDLIVGFRYYHGNFHRPVKIAEFHDIYDANMIRNHMEAEGIKSYLRGYHHRLLSYFFGPHLDMSLIIDARDKHGAQALIQDYYGGLGLVQNIHDQRAGQMAESGSITT